MMITCLPMYAHKASSCCSGWQLPLVLDVSLNGYCSENDTPLMSLLQHVLQAPLPAGCPVLLDVLFARQPSPDVSTPSGAATAAGKQQQQQQPDRRVLHVQSVSDWAPSCIGPYSQVRRCLYCDIRLLVIGEIVCAVLDLSVLPDRSYLQASVAVLK